MKKVYFFCLWLLTFGVTSLHSYNNICCMYSAERHYGWPFPFLSLWKTTDIRVEAELINTEPIFSLLSKGWHIAFAGDMASPFIWPIAIIINIAVSLGISLAIILILKGIKNLRAKKS
ncbi:MAG: hypothetical protein WAW33_00315 [Minisyncoccia bacterium]